MKMQIAYSCVHARIHCVRVASGDVRVAAWPVTCRRRESMRAFVTRIVYVLHNARVRYTQEDNVDETARASNTGITDSGNILTPPHDGICDFSFSVIDRFSLLTCKPEHSPY